MADGLGQPGIDALETIFKAVLDPRLHDNLLKSYGGVARDFYGDALDILWDRIPGILDPGDVAERPASYLQSFMKRSADAWESLLQGKPTQAAQRLGTGSPMSKAALKAMLYEGLQSKWKAQELPEAAARAMLAHLSPQMQAIQREYGKPTGKSWMKKLLSAAYAAEVADPAPGISLGEAATDVAEAATPAGPATPRPSGSGQVPNDRLKAALSQAAPVRGGSPVEQAPGTIDVDALPDSETAGGPPKKPGGGTSARPKGAIRVRISRLMRFLRSGRGMRALGTVGAGTGGALALDALLRGLHRQFGPTPIERSPELVDPQAMLNERLLARKRQKQLFDMMLANPKMAEQLQAQAAPPPDQRPVRTVLFGGGGSPNEFGGG